MFLKYDKKACIALQAGASKTLIIDTKASGIFCLLLLCFWRNRAEYFIDDRILLSQSN